MTLQQLSTMTPEQVWAYERKLGFIQPLYDAVTHAGNIRDGMSDTAIDRWHVAWTYGNERQRNYARMIFKARGYRVYDASLLMNKLPHYPQLVTYL